MNKTKSNSSKERIVNTGLIIFLVIIIITFILFLLSIKKQITIDDNIITVSFLTITAYPIGSFGYIESRKIMIKQSLIFIILILLFLFLLVLVNNGSLIRNEFLLKYYIFSIFSIFYYNLFSFISYKKYDHNIRLLGFRGVTMGMGFSITIIDIIYSLSFIILSVAYLLRVL